MTRDLRTSEVLADLTGSVNYDLLPSPVISKVKQLTLDSIACIIGGTARTQGQKAMNLFGAMGGLPQVGVLGTAMKMPLLDAVYVNSYLATVLDFDDTYDGHPGSTVVPVALSIGEMNDISGKEFLESVVAGYEIGIRISNGIKPSPARTKKVRGINTWQIFCAAAVAAKALKLGIEETAHAYCHAAIHAPVPSLRKWGFIDGRIQWLKNNFGWTSYGGVLSALLAREGFPADLTIFDSEDGFWIMASSDRCDYAAMREALGNYYTLLVHTKPYPACRHIHPTLDAVSSILAENTIDPAQIEEIGVHTFFEVVENYSFLPATPFDICFSAVYTIALLLHGIAPGLAWFSDELLRNPEILETARKVRLIEWDEANELYPLVRRELLSRVLIGEKSGRVHQATTRIPRGDPRNPMTEEETAKKFSSLVEPVMGPERTSEIYRLVMEVERLPSVKALAELLAKTP